jgi:hypothetical protein
MLEKVYFSTSTLTQVNFSSLNFKTEQTISLNFSNRAFYLPQAVLKTGYYSKSAVCYSAVLLSFLFLIYFN